MRNVSPSPNPFRIPLALVASCALMVGGAFPVEAAAARDRGKGETSARSAQARTAPAGKTARSSASPRGTRSRDSAAKPGRTVAGGTVARGTRTRASGTATYGHVSRRGHLGHHGHHGYYGWPYGWRIGYGWPWYGYGYAYPRTYVYPVHVHGDRDAPAVVETDVKPRKAEVWLDGELIGQARDYSGRWDRLYLEPGRHTLEFRREGRAPLTIELDARAGRRYVIAQTLPKGDGPGRTVALGNPPLPSDRDYAAAPDGERSPPRFGSELETADLARGLLKIQALPRDAAVYLDGEFLASAGELARLHGALPVATGVHVIEVTRPGFRSERREVTVAEGEPARVEVSLERE